MSRALGSMARRWRAVAAALVAAAAFAAVPGGTPASAAGFHAVGSASWRSSPNWNYPTGGGFGNGDGMDLWCIEYGGPAGPYGNTLWYFASDRANNTTGWINDHFLDTPGTAAYPQPQAGECRPAGPADGWSPVHFTAENAPIAVDWRNSPNWSADVFMWPGHGFQTNDSVYLYCYTFGGPAGPYGNTLWYYAADPTREVTGWINDHYLNTPGTAANPQPQTGLC